MTARYLVGDVREVLAALPAESVDLVLTSPPFLALRSYLPADHPDKPLEIGSEATPGEYIDALLDVVEACARVLAPHGSMCFELGDTYSGSGQGPDDRNYSAGAINGGRRKPGPGWPLDKSLCLIPEIFRFALVYGFNPLTGRTTPRWRARNVVRWVRPNPPVGALGDKFRPATSEMVVLCKGRRRYFDLDSVRTEHVNPRPQETNGQKNANKLDGQGHGFDKRTVNEAGAPPLDWWKISTQPYEGSHYATWPEQLCVIPVQAMCPQKVCRTCGRPSERIVSEPEYLRDDQVVSGLDPWPWGGNEVGRRGDRKSNDGGITRQVNTLGWSDCGHGDNWRPGLVLDPFAGSGTTLQVATGHGRDAIGIDLDPRNADLALQRVGPLLLTVEHHRTEEAV